MLRSNAVYFAHVIYGATSHSGDLACLSRHTFRAAKPMLNHELIIGERLCLRVAVDHTLSYVTK